MKLETTIFTDSIVSVTVESTAKSNKQWVFAEEVGSLRLLIQKHTRSARKFTLSWHSSAANIITSGNSEKSDFFPQRCSNCKKRWPKKLVVIVLNLKRNCRMYVCICVFKLKRANVHFAFIIAYNSCKWYLHILFLTHFHYEHQSIPDDWGNNADWFKWHAGLQKCMYEKQMCTKHKGHADIKSTSKRVFFIKVLFIHQLMH
jgi:hypothetical protein